MCSRQCSQSVYLIPHFSHFLLLCRYLHLIFWTLSARVLTKFDNKLAAPLALPINCNLYDIVFTISSQFLSIALISFVIGTKNVLCFSVFSPRQLNSSSKAFAIFLW